MTTRKKILIGVGVLLVGAAVAAANLYFRRETGLQVATEAIRARDLEALVSASGKIQPVRQVNISANQMGRTPFPKLGWDSPRRNASTSGPYGIGWSVL